MIKIPGDVVTVVDVSTADRCALRKCEDRPG